MSCTDVIDIIKACGENGVSEISFGDFKIVFNKHEPENVVTGFQQPIDSTLIEQYDSSDDEPEQETKLTQDDLLFTDPLAWDELAKEQVED